MDRIGKQAAATGLRDPGAIVPILQVLAPLWCSPLAAIHDDEDAAASKDEEAAGAGKIEPPKMFSYCFIILLLLDHTESYPNLMN